MTSTEIADANMNTPIPKRRLRPRRYLCLDDDLSALLEAEGRKRGVAPITLATDILATVVSDDLVGAVLDI